jgi:co-chaperonin GroES (HSP10)
MEQKILYVEQFNKARQHFKLFGNKILIERLDLGEVKTAGGIILTEASNKRSDLALQKPHVAIILAVGEGYYDSSTNSYTPLEVKPGNIVLLNSAGVQYYSTLPGAASYSANKVGLTTEGDLQMVFENLEAFKDYALALGGVLEGL